MVTDDPARVFHQLYHRLYRNQVQRALCRDTESYRDSARHPLGTVRWDAANFNLRSAG